MTGRDLVFFYLGYAIASFVAGFIADVHHPDSFRVLYIVDAASTLLPALILLTLPHIGGPLASRDKVEMSGNLMPTTTGITALGTVPSKAIPDSTVQFNTASARSCGRNEVYSSSIGQCIPKNAGNGTRVFIRHGCPYNLDKACMRTQGGLLVQCHCVS